MKASNQRGAALLTILLFTALIFILVSTMLGTVRNEISVSRLHRDGVRALEYAQAGLREGVQRIQAGHPHQQPFTGSLASNITVSVVEHALGPSGGFVEVQSEAAVGVVRRRLSQLLMFAVTSYLPNVIYGESLASQGSADITGGDVYSQTYVKYKNYPSDTTYTYAGWRVRKLTGGGSSTEWCYTPQDCLNQNPVGDPDRPHVQRWYPGSRRAAWEDLPLTATVGWGVDDRVTTTELGFTCEVDGPLAGSITVSHASLPVGARWAEGDTRQDNQPMPADTPLYGCETDLLPYTWVREEFVDDEGNPQRMWFKTIRFEQWRDKYWYFDDETLKWEKKGPGKQVTAEPNLFGSPEYGAVPPFPNFEALVGSGYDQYQTGGGTINASTTLNLGCYAPAMTCPGGESNPQVVFLDDGDYHINANLQGHGTLLVDGNLIVNGTLEYWGTVVVNGDVEIGNGTVTIHGGLIARSTTELSGNITVEGGTNIASVPVGPAIVFARAWWER